MVVPPYAAPLDSAGPLSSKLPGRVLSSAWTVAGSVLVVCLLWLAIYFGTGRSVWTFVDIGRRYVVRSHASAVIRLDPHAQYASDMGFDGQFYYFVAVDPVNARYYIPRDGDRNPDYVYTRVVYPMMARLLALGRTDLIPYTLVLVNVLAIAGGTLAMAAWLGRKGFSPWLALLYGLYPGFWIALMRDCVDALAFALVVLAYYLLDCGGPRRAVLSGAVFGAAALTRETVIVFPLVLGVWLVAGCPARDWKARLARGSSMLLPGVLPVLLYKCFLVYWLHGLPEWPSRGRLQIIPFHGLFEYWPAQAFDRAVAAATISIPAMICAALAVLALSRGVRQPQAYLLLVNVQLFVVMLNPHHYMVLFGAPRHAAAVIPCALFCLPIFDAVSGQNRAWLALAGACWLAPMVVYLGAIPSMMLLG